MKRKGKYNISLITPAIKITQYNFPELSGDPVFTPSTLTTDLYLTTMTVLDLVRLDVKIDRWTPENREGYQRGIEDRRVHKSIPSYMVKEYGLLPTSIFLNVRGNDELLFLEAQSHLKRPISIGQLFLFENTKLYVVDGQHRFLALISLLREASKVSSRIQDKVYNYALPVTITNLSKEEEMILFHIINTRQRRIAPVLSYRIANYLLKKAQTHPRVGRGIIYNLLPSEKAKWVSKAVDIVDYLNLMPNSPFRNKIKIIGSEGRYPVSEKTVIESLEPILRQEFFSNIDLETLANWLIDYWNAIFSIYPKAKQYPREYTIMGYTGILAFHRIFPEIYVITLKNGYKANQDGFEKILFLGLNADTPNHKNSLFKGRIKIDYWRKRNNPHTIFTATNKKIINELAANLLEKITHALS